MAAATLEKILREARKLSPRERAELIATLLHEVEDAPLLPDIRERFALEPIIGMSGNELEALAKAILAPGRQQRLRTLLRKNKEGALSDRENQELDAILEESDRLALLKAKAQYTLLISRHPPGALI